MKRLGILFTAAVLVFMVNTPCWPESPADPSEEEQVQQLDDVVVKDKTGVQGVEQTPLETKIEVPELPTVGVPNSIVDVLKGHAVIDFRGQSDIDAGVDSINLRGNGSVRLAAEGLAKPWHTKFKHLSPKYTTRWDQLPKVS